MMFSVAEFARRCSAITVVVVGIGVTMGDLAGQASSVTPEDILKFNTDTSAALWRGIEVSIPMNDRNMKAAGIAITAVEPEKERADLTFPGTVSIPQHRLRIVSAPRSGSVETMLVSPGHTIAEGQPVARIHTSDLVEAQKNYLTAIAEDEADADRLQRARASGNAVSKRELHAAEAQARASKAKVEARRQVLLSSGMGKEDLETLRTGKAVLDKIVVRSTVSGTVISRHADNGAQIKSADPLYILDVTDPLQVNIPVPARRLATIAVGSAVSLPAYRLSGKIVRIERDADQGTAVALAEINDAGSRLRPGVALSVTVQVPPADTSLANRDWTVPSASVVRHRDQTWVFMRSADGFRARPVQIVNESARTVAVRGDFRVHDEVASSGVPMLLSELVDADKED